jgi:hypothetical protein
MTIHMPAPNSSLLSAASDGGSLVCPRFAALFKAWEDHPAEMLTKAFHILKTKTYNIKDNSDHQATAWTHANIFSIT